MTKEEAIFELYNTAWLHHDDNNNIEEAVELAVTALREWEPVVRCKDCDRGKSTAVGWVCTLTGASVAGDGTGYCNNGRQK